jgi:hypothetical protein
MDWLSSKTISSLHNAVKVNRTAGTCQWLLDSNRYKNWRRSSGFLWLYGAGEFAWIAFQGQANDEYSRMWKNFLMV